MHGLIVDLLADLEKARRRGDYSEMQVAADNATVLLVDDTSSEAFKARAKISYELHMGAYQQGKFELSLQLAEKSVDEAQKAGDAVGVLFTKMNIGGLLLPAMGKWRDGVNMHQQTLAEVERLLPAAPKEDVPRLQRVAMNCYCHNIRHSVANASSDVDHIAEWRDKLVLNPIFIDNHLSDDPREPGPAKDLQDGRNYITRHSNRPMLER